MIAFEEALALVLKESRDFGSVSIATMDAMGRILREDLIADRDFPPYDRVTMDGIAINFQAFAAGKRSFIIEGIAAAGAPQKTLQHLDNCLEVMTGAMLPVNADTVIRYEDLQIENGVAKLEIDALEAWKNIHRQGSDRAIGTKLVSRGSIIGAAEIGVAATVGKTSLSVAQLPKIAVIATGDELVEIDEKPLPHQIRKSNLYTIAASLKQINLEVSLHHLVDDLESVKKELEVLVSDNQILVLSGGVSKGKYDYLPEALQYIGVEQLFHRVKQRPGKPFWFGKAPNGTLVFALPGNPVSSFMCTRRYLIPFLEKSLIGDISKPQWAVLAEDFRFKPDLTYFLQVELSTNEKGQLMAKPVEGNGSGDLANLTDANAFMQLPRGKDFFEQGGVYPVFPFQIGASY